MSQEVSSSAPSGTIKPDFSIYSKGQKLSRIETRPGGNLLLPIHRFVSIPILGDLDSMTEFSREYLQFVCACLNERSNGTIHFGIRETRSSPPVDGEVVGVSLKSESDSYQTFLTKAIEKCFTEQQARIALQCVQPAKFWKVPSDETETETFVIDIDVIPNNNLCNELIFSVKLPTPAKGVYEGPHVIRIMDGNTRPLREQEIIRFQEEIPSLYKQRKQLEDEFNESKIPENVDAGLSEKFIKLLCHGDTKLQGDHYEILVINKPAKDMDKEFITSTLSFLADIQWRVIFDFDSQATMCQFVQDQGKAIIVAKTDDFNSRSELNTKDPEKLKELHEYLKTSVNPAWLFVNGYDQTNDHNLSPRLWKRGKSEGFKEAVRFFGSQIPKGRAMVVFVLLSPDTEIILEAAEEFITMFEDQWMCIAENEEIGKPWMDELVRRHCVDEDSDRNIWGLPWSHLQKTVYKLLGPKKINLFEIPTSRGTTVKLENKIVNELIDIEILSCTECENSEFQFDKKTMFDFELRTREEYYKGAMVSWWNFRFPGQVCKRDIFEKIKKQVKKGLDGGIKEDIVGRVFLYHQPGAGGTTVARHILWELRKQYRCGLIHNITEESLPEQILNLYSYKDQNPKPLLLVLDNPDTDKANLLFVALSEQARRLERKVNDQSNVVLCVFLICVRCTKFKSSTDDKFLLQHELSSKELTWFAEKNKSLIKEFQNKENTLINPRLLISFNLMKEGFDKNYMRRTVKEFVDNISDGNERKLLKYVSLLNAFDFENRPIPTSSFDGMMIINPWLQGGPRRGRKAISRRWETNLSPDIRVLLNETSRPAMGHIHSLRITSVLLAKEILLILQSTSEPVATTSDIVIEFLGFRDIFNVTNLARENLVPIFKDVLRRRQLNTDGKPETTFSLLIEDIMHRKSQLIKPFALWRKPWN